MQILDPIRLVMRQKACQICYETENVNELNPFMDLKTVDFHYGYQYCNKCEDQITESMKKLNDLCKNIIEEKIYIKYDSFEIKNFDDILKNKKLIVKRTNNDIEDNWKFSGYMYSGEFYIIAVDNSEQLTKNVNLGDFLEYNSYVFL